MGFFGFLGGKLGAGRALQKAAMEDAHASEIAAKKLVILARAVEEPIRKLAKIRQPLSSADLMSAKDRRRIESILEDVGSPAAAKEIQARAVKEVAKYLQGFSSALITVYGEYATTKAASKAEMDQMLSAGLKESHEEMAKMMKDAMGAINRLNMKRAQEIREEYNKVA